MNETGEYTAINKVEQAKSCFTYKLIFQFFAVHERHVEEGTEDCGQAISSSGILLGISQANQVSYWIYRGKGLLLPIECSS